MAFEVSVNINAPDIVQAVMGLTAALLAHKPAQQASTAPQIQAPAPPVTLPPAQPAIQPVTPPVAPAVPVAPVQQYAPAATLAVPAPPPAAPTAVQEYTTDQISRAAGTLIDAGKLDALRGLLQQFGVQAVTQLPKEQYGAFATQLRGMGAQI